MLKVKQSRFLKHPIVANFLNEKVINLLKILESFDQDQMITCNHFMGIALQRKYMSRSSFFRYLDGLKKYDLIEKKDQGITKDGHLVYYWITQNGKIVLETYEAYFMGESSEYFDC